MNMNDLRDATADAVALQLGARILSPHPHARDRYGTLRDVMGKLSTLDFASAFANGVGAAVQQGYDAGSQHREICATIPVKDMKNYGFPIIDLNLDDSKYDTALKESGEAPENIIMMNTAGSTGYVSRFSNIVRFTLEFVENDTIGVARGLISSITQLPLRRERRAVFGILTSNAVLAADGRALCNATDGNDLGSSATLSVANVGTGLAAMRRQKTAAGNECEHRARFLIVSPEAESTALQVVKTLTNEGEAPRLKVVVTNSIAAGSSAWWLLADPVSAPVLGFLVMSGDGQTIKTRAVTAFTSSGADVAIDHYFGVVPLSRIGVVRGGV